MRRLQSQLRAAEERSSSSTPQDKPLAQPANAAAAAAAASTDIGHQVREVKANRQPAHSASASQEAGEGRSAKRGLASHPAADIEVELLEGSETATSSTRHQQEENAAAVSRDEQNSSKQSLQLLNQSLIR